MHFLWKYNKDLSSGYMVRKPKSCSFTMNFVDTNICDTIGTHNLPELRALQSAAT